ncbi:MAG: iron chelate uptake ABC transporter family permease subunit [Candidatus Stahlbacteria bacterium]|nr:iron chelate uptake ABC transporter family permease subunit [Candidatus Stahlbacteria bacterium]
MTKLGIKIGGLTLIVVVICFCSLISGPMGVQVPKEVILGIRLPRLLLGIFAGLLLSTSGVALQGILQNPLADPYVLGISGGACVGAVCALLLNLPIPLFAFLGSLVSIFAVYRLASFQGRIPRDTLLLSGIVVGTFTGSLVMLMMTLASKGLEQIIYLLMGHLGMMFGLIGFKIFCIVFIVSIILLLLILRRARELNILSLGEEEAMTMGVDVERIKREIFILTSALIGLCVAFCGAIGFIGLMVPHITRKLVGPDHRILLIVSPFIGVILILLADIVARNTLAFELPVGVITSLMGVPFFIWLLRRQKT